MSGVMVWVFAVLIVLAMGGVAMVAAGRGAPMAPAYDDRPDALVPRDRPIGADDLRGVRFSLALRGYRMGEVDRLLARVAAEMERQEVAESESESDSASEPVLRAESSPADESPVMAESEPAQDVDQA